MTQGDSSSPYFARPAYLSVSSQLHLEAFANSISRVYTIQPAFRAEKSQNTSRHLSEFWMLEAEMAFATSLGDIMDVVENSIKGVLSHPAVLETLATPVEGSNTAIPENLSDFAQRWPRITYTKAIELLNAREASPPPPSPSDPPEAPQVSQNIYDLDWTSPLPVPTMKPALLKWGQSLSNKDERWIAEVWGQNQPVFITDYPAATKPFYMLPHDKTADTDKATVQCFDLVVPRVGELVGGSLREHRLSELMFALEKHGLDREKYAWYLDLRRCVVDCIFFTRTVSY